MPLRSTYAQRKNFPPYALPYIPPMSCQCMCAVPNLRCGRALLYAAVLGAAL
jgi:hypothetical protein